MTIMCRIAVGVLALASSVPAFAQGNSHKKDRPPSVAIVSPASGTVYTSAQTATITASANDDRSVVKVDFFETYNGVTAMRSTDAAAPYTVEFSVASVNNGLHTWTARATDTAGQTKTSAAISLTVLVVDQPPPTEPPPSTVTTVGPKTGVICPTGSVDVWPGADIQGLVNAYVGATTFCLRQGTHRLLNSITPRSGNAFIGEYGAIIDGSGWATADATKGAFRAWNQDIDDVTIRNLLIRNVPMGGVTAFRDFADRWTVEDVEIGPCGGTGINLPHSSALRRSYVHHCVVGGYAAYLSNNSTWEDNEFAYNGNESKICLTAGTIFRRSFVHHSVNGIWFDGENIQSRIEDNRVEDNVGVGIYYEVSGQGIIRNNVARRNGEHGVLVSGSHSVDVSGNTLDDNWRGVTFFVDCSRMANDGGSGGGGAYVYPGHTSEPFYMQDVSVHDNAITIRAQADVFAAGFGYTGCTATQLNAYLTGVKNLTFANNDYRVPSMTGWYWLWNGFKTWAEWQALGQDATGTVQPR
jgi:parallel beta-helix repeat protein